MSLGEVCNHGALKRSCYVCELEAERDKLLAKMVKRNTELIKANDDVNLLKARVERLEKALKEMLKLYRNNLSHEHGVVPSKECDTEYFEAKEALKADGEGK